MNDESKRCYRYISLHNEEDLAKLIARSIFKEGDWPTACHRIQFMGGSYPNQEVCQGGYNEPAFAKAVERALNLAAWDEKGEMPTLQSEPKGER